MSKGIKDLINSIKKLTGDQESIRLASSNIKLDTVSTGSLMLDHRLGGGIPVGRITELYGLESSGKTTLALSIARAAQLENPNNYVAFIDTENAITQSLLQMNQIDLERFILCNPTSGELVFEMIQQQLKYNSKAKDDAKEDRVAVIIVDSVAAITSNAEMQGTMSDIQVGSQARLISKGLRKIIGSLATSGCALVFINQVRSKIGIVYGNPLTTTGGHALKFYASVRIHIKKINKNRTEDIAHTMQVSVKKNKLAAIDTPVVLEVIFGQGIDRINELVNIAIERDIITNSGSWFYYNGEKLAQGRSKCVALLKKNAEMLDLQKKTPLLVAFHVFSHLCNRVILHGYESFPF